MPVDRTRSLARCDAQRRDQARGERRQSCQGRSATASLGISKGGRLARSYTASNRASRCRGRVARGVGGGGTPRRSGRRSGGRCHRLLVGRRTEPAERTWDGRDRGPTLRRPSRKGWFGTDGRIRTDTGRGLSAVPLPVGLRQRGHGSRSRTCQVERMKLHGSRISRERGLRWGDRPDSNRLPPGPHPGVSSTSTSVTTWRCASSALARSVLPEDQANEGEEARPGHARSRRRIPRSAHRAGWWCRRHDSNVQPPGS